MVDEPELGQEELGIERVEFPEEEGYKPLEIIKDYITKDARERSELTKREIYALSQLAAIAHELEWEFTEGVVEHYLHMMRSHNRQGIKEDVQLLSGMILQTMPLGMVSPLAQRPPEQP